MTQKTLYGIVNVCFYAPAGGNTTFYLTRKSRDRALAALRDLAVERGLALDSALAGIRPVKRVIRNLGIDPAAERAYERAADNERDLIEEDAWNERDRAAEAAANAEDAAANAEA